MKPRSILPLHFSVILLLCAAVLRASEPAQGAAPTDGQILDEADARIEQIRKSDAVLRLIGPDGKALPAGASVKIEQTRHEFLFGCNIFGLTERGGAQVNEDYARRFADLFNFATIPFYWWTYEAQRGNVGMGQARADRMAQWCREHGITAKGHSLVYNLGDPWWLPDDNAEIRKLQQERITRDVSHFKGRIQYWDVANEITMFDRPTTQQRSPKLTRAIKEADTLSFIRQAFTLTHATDPAARLLINDYVTDQGYADTVIAKLVGEQKEPVYDIVGVQAHQHSKAWSVSKIWESCERFAKFGKPVHITEVTFTSGKAGMKFNESRRNPDWVTTPEGERRQAEEVARFYTTLFSHPAVEAITWWDLSDRGAWMDAPAGLIRKDMTPKPAYEALMKLIKGKWWTKAQVAVGDGGTVKLRGFRGDYRVTVTGTDGKTMEGTFTLGRNGTEAIEVKLATNK